MLAGIGLPPDLQTGIVNFAYLIAAVLFIMGIKGLAHPRTAVRGNTLGAVGMLLAVVVTLVDQSVVRFELIIAGFAVGAFLGVVLATRIQMTSMPQLVAIFNGFGGGASVLVATATFLVAVGSGDGLGTQMVVATAVSALIGAVTLSGSLIAFFKLQGIVVPSGAVVSRLFTVANIAFLSASVTAAVLVYWAPSETVWFWVLVTSAVALGVTLVVPIGGADMPVVIALLNSYSGLAASGTGFVLNNNVLIIAGSLVGASGLILTRIMCKAMNRSLTNVLFGGFGSQEVSETTSGEDIYAGKVKASSAEEASMLLEGSRRVAIVPGYGMAVAQAQHAVRDLTVSLSKQGVDVVFAIHPVAGRMPGHMNVLLAEADIPYDQLLELEQVNPQFPEIDTVLVLGANDVVNPLARTDPSSPIAGMPILDVDKARTVIVVKRSLSPGFAGIANPLFAADNTIMLFGDAKQVMVELSNAVVAAAA